MGESYFLDFWSEVWTISFLTTFCSVIMADFSINKKDFWVGTLNVYCVITKQLNPTPK